MAKISIPKEILARDTKALEPQVNYQIPINQWDEADRPREKMLRLGAGVLSDAELIGLIFGTGTTTKEGPVSAIQLGQALLREFKSLARLSKRDLNEIRRIFGIGPAKAVQLMAAFEIGRRVEASLEERIKITNPADVARVYGPQLRDLPREVFKIILLNTANVIMTDYTLTEGGLAASIVEPRMVFRRAVIDNAAGIICMHNHPSGNLEPSREDIRITKQLIEAGKLMNIPVHDHIIIAGRGYTSFAERGLMD